MIRARWLRLLGVMLVAAAALWQLWGAEVWARRIPAGWSWTATYTGSFTWADSAGQLPPEDQLADYRRSLRAEVDPGSGTLSLQNAMTVLDPATRRIIYEYVTHEQVDPATGAFLTPRYRGQVALFPRHVERRTYVLRSNYVEGIPLAFEGEEAVLGVLTYRFGYMGRGEYTASYAGTGEYPGFRVAPGHEIRCGDDQFIYRVWVEPVSGEIVKLEESCRAGDYVYDIATSTRGAAVDRWEGVTSGRDLYRLADAARRERNRLLWGSRVGPLLAVAGAILLLAGLIAGRLERVR